MKCVIKATSDAEHNPSKGAPPVPAGLPEEVVDVVRGQRTDDGRVPPENVVDPDPADAGEPGEQDRREEEPDAARPIVLQREEPHQHDAREQHRVVCNAESSISCSSERQCGSRVHAYFHVALGT